MRLLVACSECHRQYKAREDKIGTRFRCRCGNVLTVAPPRGHDSAVIRCSSCGAARGHGGRDCEHCGADFTLHERDLHTVCPECLTRVSDHACYCHHCGGLLSPEEEIGATTDLHCPSCVAEPLLHSRQLGVDNISALECDACAGLWLGNEVFQHLARLARDATVPPLFTDREQRGELLRPDQPPQRAGYCPCPICGDFMNRDNYGYRPDEPGSRTIIEYCKSHGIWFNSRELADILGWLRRGGTPQQPGHLIKEPRQLREEEDPLPVFDPWPRNRDPINVFNIFDILLDPNDVATMTMGDIFQYLFHTRSR